MPDEEKVMKSMIGEAVKSEEITIPKGTYDDLEYKIDIIIGPETMDLSEREQRMTMLLNMANNNPALFTPAEIKAIKRKALESGGINPHELGGDEPVQNLAETMSQMKGQGQGGSLPKMMPQQIPQGAPAGATI